MPRKHRRVHHPRTNCRCPEGSKRVETCGKKGDPKCRGRNIGCIARVSLPDAKKPLPRFVKPVCDQEAGPVEQWKPPPGTKRKRASKTTKQPLPTKQPVYSYSNEDFPALRKIANQQKMSPVRTLHPQEQKPLPFFRNEPFFLAPPVYGPRVEHDETRPSNVFPFRPPSRPPVERRTRKRESSPAQSDRPSVPPWWVT